MCQPWLSQLHFRVIRNVICFLLTSTGFSACSAPTPKTAEPTPHPPRVMTQETARQAEDDANRLEAHGPAPSYSAPGNDGRPPRSRVVRFDPREASFFELDNGVDLRTFDPYGRLKIHHGLGTPFGDSQWKRYEDLKRDAQVQWAVGDPTTGTILAQSTMSRESIYGASITKPVIVAALLERRGGELSSREWRDVIELLTLSDNTPWNALEVAAGGKESLDDFTRRHGYGGVLAAQRDNRVNATGLVRFLHDVYQGKFAGAEALFKVMAACATGTTKARKYLPRGVQMAGKTGTTQIYRHDMRFLFIHDGWYTLAVLTRHGDNEDVALLFGGLAREYLGCEAEAG
jgi:beta-lactamase family protein